MSELKNKEAYVSVDIEAAGPNPSQYSMLSIGAWIVGFPQKTFYIELKPIHTNYSPEALEINSLSLDSLTKTGMEPGEAMRRFEDWIQAETPSGYKPVFVAFNAPFDWMFINDYFMRYLGRNPFGHTALDIKSYYMGFKGCSWQETTMGSIGPQYFENHHHTHNALQDALDQGKIFEMLLAQTSGKPKGDPS
jgi:DNA polymerase III epsilon subunit-like protein